VTSTGKQRCAFGPFCLDRSEHLLTRRGVAVPLPPKCFDLLALLVQYAGSLVEKNRIIETLWPDTFVEEANVANLIGLLRKTLGDSPKNPRYIQTVPKRGYRFVGRLNSTDRKPPSLAEKPDVDQRAIRIIAFPFRNDSGDPEMDYLAYSLPDAIGSTLAELNVFTVRSTQLAARFDPKRWDPQSVAREADVDVLLTGCFARTGLKLHVITQLLDAPNGTVLWSKEWDVDPKELFRLHRGVVQLLVRTLAGQVRQSAGLAGDEKGSTIPDAYELYLRANYLTRKRTTENFTLARDLYLACTEKDPAYAPAWAGLGRCCRFLDKFGVRLTGNAISAEDAFRRALRLNPQLAIAHSAYTPLQADLGHAEEAVVRLLHAVQQNKNNPELFAGLVHACRYCGQLAASIAAHNRALALDRNVPTSVAHTYFLMGDYEKSLYWYGEAAGPGAGLYLDALSLTCMDRLGDASALLWARRDRFCMQPALMNSLQAYLDGDRAAGVAALRSAHSGSGDPETLFYLARQAARFEEVEMAQELLSRSVKRGYLSSVALSQDSWLKPLRTTSEFTRLLSVVKSREEEARRAFLQAGSGHILGRA